VSIKRRKIMNIHTHYLDRIARDIDAFGIAATEDGVGDVVERGRTAGVNPVLLSVLSDVAQPEIARARAFGMVAGALAAVKDAPSIVERLAIAGPSLVAAAI
jgi:hypothetical protein